MSVALFPGHHVYGKPAEAGGYNEHSLCRMVVDKAKCEVQRRFFQHALQILDPHPDIDRSYCRTFRSATNSAALNGRIAWCNAIPDLDAVVECHLNSSGDDTVDYPLIVVQPTVPESYDIAHAIGEQWHALGFITKPLKVWTPQELQSGRKALIEEVRAPTVILEPMFLSCTRVQDWIAADIDDWIGRYAEGIVTGLMIVAW